ncbi:MAG TPA: hypothetical protein VHO47_00920 [Candidatus Babeliales bacterium]|nr:hypothetical protein [Candidatus Babeliales bacterium]
MAHKKKSTHKKHEFSLLDLLLGHTDKRKKAHHGKKKTAKKASARKGTKKAVKAKGKGAYGRNPYR